MISRRRILTFCTVVLLIFLLLQHTRRSAVDFTPETISPTTVQDYPTAVKPHQEPLKTEGKFDWAKVPHRYPVSSFRPLPSPRPASIPKIQGSFGRESTEQRRIRLQRLAAVKGNFTHAWNGYKTNAWLRDEVAPLSGNGLDHFGGWAATLVDSLGEYTASVPIVRTF
jgi:mannosyl-oligosaccharide alpha-1,2-mannosidase